MMLFKVCSVLFCILGLTLSKREDVLEQHYAVTSFRGLENYYLEIRRNQNPSISVQRSFTSNKQICNQIFHSKWRGSGEILIDRGAMRLNVPKKVFEYERKKKRLFEFRIPKVAVQGSLYDEKTFTCLIYNIVLNKIKPYFVSRHAYNVNEVPGGAFFIPGRFIFSEYRNIMRVHALAEERAERGSFEGGRLAAFYHHRRSRYLQAQEVKDDPVCKLDINRKFRICNSISMYLYEKTRGKFKVTVEDECEKKQFTLSDKPAADIYEEWMMLCRITGRLNEIFYISRSYAHNEVFVFMISDDKLRIKFLAQKMAVVIDDPILLVDEKSLPMMEKRSYFIDSNCSIL